MASPQRRMSDPAGWRRPVGPSGISLVLFGILAAATPAAPSAAQEPSAPQIDSLRAEIRALQSQLDSLRALIEAQADARAEREAADAASELERLRAAARAAAGAAGPAPAERDTQEFVGRQRSLQALNPEISVTGDIFGAVSSENSGEDNFVPREFEFSFQAALDPYSRAKIFVGAHTPGAEIEAFEGHGHEGEPGLEGEGEEAGHEEEGGVGVEEGYLEWVNLPGGLGLKLGKFFQQFGTLNRWHGHALPVQSRSFPHIAFIGEEALAQSGASVRWLLPSAGVGALETTFEVTRSSNEALFGENTGLSYLGHVNGFWQLSESIDLDLGVSALFGEFADEDATYDQRLYGVEGALTWTPPGRARYRGAVVRGGVMVRDPQGAPAELGLGSATGYWGLTEFRVGQQWLIGGRGGWVENPSDPDESAWLLAPTLTWWQSEWVRVRAEYDAVRRDDETTGLFVLQVTLSMGPHKHETY